MSINSTSTTSSIKEISRPSTTHDITAINMIDKDLIKAFQTNNKHAYHNNIFNMSAAVWKYTAKLSGPSNIQFNGNKCINHYNMQDIADYLDDNYPKIMQNYKKRIRIVRLGFMRVPVYKHYTYRNKSGNFRTTSSFQGYCAMPGFIKGHQLIDFYTGVHHNLLGKKVDYYTTFTNFHDFNNYLAEKGYPKVGYKDFKAFLLRNKVDCRKLPNPNNKHEMQASHKADVIVAKLIRQKQLKYNKQDPTALQLRELAKQHKYNEFLAALMSQYNNINQCCLAKEAYKLVYFHGHFHMPKHLVDWLASHSI